MSFASFIGVVVIVVLLAAALVASVVSMKGSISSLEMPLRRPRRSTEA